MGPGQRNQDLIRKRVETLEETKMASNGFNEPPSFISDEKSMAEYEEDVLMWSRLTTLQPEVHAEAIVFHLGKQKHPIKEKIMTAIGSKIKNNKEGLSELIKFLKTIYKADEMADAFSKYVDFEKRKRENGEKIQECNLLQQRVGLLAVIERQHNDCSNRLKVTTQSCIFTKVA